MTEPAPPQRGGEDLRPVPPSTPGVRWNAMRLALLIVVLFAIAYFAWLAAR